MVKLFPALAFCLLFIPRFASADSSDPPAQGGQDLSKLDIEQLMQITVEAASNIAGRS